MAKYHLSQAAVADNNIASFQQIQNTIDDGLFGILEPAIGNSLINSYGNQGIDYFSYIKSLGYMKSTGRPTYSYFADDWWHQKFVVKTGVAASSAGGSVQLTLDSSVIDTSNRFYPQFGDNVYFPGNVQGYIYSVVVTVPSAPVFTIQVNDVNGIIPATTTGQQLMIGGNTNSQGSTNDRKSMMHDKNLFSNTTCIVKTPYSVTGSDMAEGGLYVSKDTEGNMIDSLPAYERFIAEYEHHLAVSMKLLTDQQVTATNGNEVDPTNDLGFNFTGTNGLVTEMQSLAAQQSYVPSALTINNFYSQSRNLEKLGISSGEYIFHLDGTDLEFVWQQMLSTQFAAAQADGMYNKKVASRFFNNNSTGLNGEALSATLDYTAITVAQRCHIFNNLKMLTHPQLLGIEGYGAGSWGMLIPMKNNSVKIDNIDTSRPTIGMRYKEYGGYNRMVELNITGGANMANATNNYDRKSWQWRSEIGAEHVNLFQCIFMQAA